MMTMELLSSPDMASRAPLLAAALFPLQAGCLLPAAAEPRSPGASQKWRHRHKHLESGRLLYSSVSTCGSWISQTPLSHAILLVILALALLLRLVVPDEEHDDEEAAGAASTLNSFELSTLPPPITLQSPPAETAPSLAEYASLGRGSAAAEQGGEAGRDTARRLAGLLLLLRALSQAWRRRAAAVMDEDAREQVRLATSTGLAGLKVDMCMPLLMHGPGFVQQR